AGDPTYPFYPIVCIVSAGLLLLVLFTSFIRQSWNLGVAFLCFWLFFENLTEGVNSIIWADNADIKLYVYCDIVSRLQILTSIVKPMATLIITRRLYLIASLQSVILPDKTAVQYMDMGIEWTLGLIIPVIVTDYIVQVERFQVQGAFGCTNALDDSILRILLVSSWSVIPPLISIALSARMARILYRRRHDISNFLQSNNSVVSQSHYIRILALASIDVLLTLPIGIVSVVLAVTQSLSFNGLPFYSGWTFVHTDWEPESMPYSVLVTFGTSNIAKLYFNRWASPVLAFVVFGLFGVTSDARASYR
ncbi:fungal pheromone STE3G-protein-coupled receptor, partial [Peniophora sp. CONT]